VTKHLAFVTDGLIDLRAFTTFGFNSKPNTTSPIGFFGTGLKIATAVIARMGCRMTVMIDGVQHEFYTKEADFRGKKFDMIRMRKRKGMLSKWSYQEMPYTTELGKNWEAWQVFRELESNTRDENGYTIVVDDEDPHGMSFLNDDHRGKTVIIIDEPSVIKAYDERDTIFLPKDLELRSKGNRCEAYNVGSKYLFYRGMRVVELAVPSAFTYNITAEQRLTEDRTLYSWYASWEARQLIMESTDEDFVDQIVQLDEEKFWEAKIEFDDVNAISSETFRKVIRRRKNSGGHIMSRVSTFYDRYYVPEPTDPDVTITFKQSEWKRIHQVLSEVDTYDLAPKLGWAEEDDRFDSFVALREQFFQKAPMDVEAVDFTPEPPAKEPDDVDPPVVADGDDDIPF
jgi:hypothetical protein